MRETKSNPVPSAFTEESSQSSYLARNVNNYFLFFYQLCVLHTLANLIFTANNALIIISILRIRELNLREVNLLFQGSTGGKWLCLLTSLHCQVTFLNETGLSGIGIPIL